MLAIIDESLPKIATIQFKFIKSQYSYVEDTYKVSNIESVYKYLEKLKEINPIKRDIDYLFEKFDYIITEQLELSISRDDFTNLKKEIEDLKFKCNSIKEILNQIIQPQDENTISFKLYEFNSFSDFSDFCNDLNKKILVPLDRLKIKVQLGELEMGSAWLSIIIGTGLGVLLITAIIRQAFDILIHDYQKFKVASKVIEGLEMEESAIAEFNKKVLEQKEKIINERVEQIFVDAKNDSEFPKDIDDGELSELKIAIKLSLESMEKHIDKGLMVYQALDVKENERYKLPDFTELIAIKQPPKLITDNSEEALINTKTPSEKN
jgi:hypothetical protein